jgi:primosomal replication protein N
LNQVKQLNQVKLTACIAEASPLRYTPAGIPALNLVLEHESEAVEGGVTRQVKLIVRAVAFGALAETAGRIELGRPRLFTGFLINARTSKSIVFHIQSIDQLSQEDADQEQITL